MSRNYIDDGELYRIAAEKTEELCGQNKTFTAYSITEILRTEHPLDEITHSRVRVAVHEYMDRVGLAKFNYTVTSLLYSGNLAATYKPAPVKSADPTPVPPDPGQQVDDPKTLTLTVPIDWSKILSN